MDNVKPLKILHLTTHLNIGGITQYCLLVGKRMIRDGHEVTVLSSGGEMAVEFEKAGIPLLIFPIKVKSILSPRLWFNFFGIFSVVKKGNFDLLHAHTRVTQALAAVLSIFIGLPVVTTSHGFFKRNLGRKIFPCWGQRVIAISSVVADELQKTHKVKSQKIRIIFNAIDFVEHRQKLSAQNPSEIRRRLGLRESTFVVGCIARLVRDKGQEFLIEAAARLKKKYSDMAILVIGDGRERKNLENLITKRSLGNQAQLISSQTDPVPYYSIMDAFVHPGTYREGFGLAILEAMASKIPVVASDIWSINTIIRNRVNGFLVEPKNASEIEKTLMEIIENPEFAGTMAENAYQMASQSYSMDRMVRELETVYYEVLGK